MNKDNKDNKNKQYYIEFAEWCIKEKYTFYFNGKDWIWGHARKQEYYTSEELYDKWEALRIHTKKRA